MHVSQSFLPDAYLRQAEKLDQPPLLSDADIHQLKLCNMYIQDFWSIDGPLSLSFYAEMSVLHDFTLTQFSKNNKIRTWHTIWIHPSFNLFSLFKHMIQTCLN